MAATKSPDLGTFGDAANEPLALVDVGQRSEPRFLFLPLSLAFALAREGEAAVYVSDTYARRRIDTAEGPAAHS
jgi:hypothetical protein